MMSTLVPSRMVRVTPATYDSVTMGSTTRSNGLGHIFPGTGGYSFRGSRA